MFNAPSPEIDPGFFAAVAIGGMGYHIYELKNRFGVALPSEKFIKVSQALRPATLRFSVG